MTDVLRWNMIELKNMFIKKLVLAVLDLDKTITNKILTGCDTGAE